MQPILGTIGIKETYDVKFLETNELLKTLVAACKRDGDGGNIIEALKPHYRYAPTILESFPTLQVKNLGIDLPAIIADASSVTWLYSKRIYTFDKQLLDSLANTRLEKIPLNLFQYLPYPAFFVCFRFLLRQGEGLEWITDGFLFSRCSDEYLNFMWLFANYKDGPIFYSLKIKIFGTVEEITDWWEKNDCDKQKNEAAKTLCKTIFSLTIRVLPFIIYLCSDEPDVTLAEKGSCPNRPEPKKIKRGVRYFYATSASVFNVGNKIGEQIREATSAMDSATEKKEVAPHIRKAHWHLFWTGKGKKEPRMKFLPPILVNASEFANKGEEQ